MTLGILHEKKELFMKNEYDVVIVGAGPAGSMAARFAAEQGVSVLMLEKDRDIGSPVRCGEAISKAHVEEFITPDDSFISSKITKFSLTAPNNMEVILEFGDAGFVLERRIFDYELAKTAAKAGAEILTRAYVNGLIFEENKVSGVKFEYRGEKKEVRAKVVIGADGVESRVGRWAGIKTFTDFRDMECCVQLTCSNIDIDPNTLYFYFGEKVAPGGYFWVFPKQNKAANIGLGVSGMVGKRKSALRYLNDFMDSHYPAAPVLTQIAGGVPSCPTLKRITAPGIMLAGDAARQVNPLSGGGIASGMIGGSLAGKFAADAIKKRDITLISKYEEAWYDRVGKRHEIFNRLKKGIYDFDDYKFNSIAKSFSKVPMEKRTLGSLFRTALFNHPLLLLDIAKVFIV
jgi:digeranylgeranylglycerophospholipid reductase